jgi:hypothetical protein
LGDLIKNTIPFPCGERNWYFYFNYVIYLQGNNIFIYVVFTVKGNF